MNNVKKRQSDFVQVSNSFLRDNNISFKAKGLFCYMFSMSDNWNFTIKSIATQQKDGTASIISSMNELKEYGYISYTKHTNGSGTYYLDDKPNAGNPNVENPNMGKSTPIKKTISNKKNNSKVHPLLAKYKASKDTKENEDKIILDFINYRITISKPIKTIIPLNTYWKVITKLFKDNYNIVECINYMKSKEWQTISEDYLKNTSIKPIKAVAKGAEYLNGHTVG